MSAIIGRKKEIGQLDKIKASRKSEFVAVYGRRRVGKTFLVREYFEYQFDFQLTGLANANTQQQLTNFHATLRRYAPAYDKSIPSNWFEAFQDLISCLETIQGDRKKIIFLDELPWLATPKSDFMMSLEHFWNSWATNRKDIILIACGSAASWMISELINNRGGLHNRVTERIKIHPFNLGETERLLQSKNIVLDRYQILQLYMVMGGIPYYLDAVSPEKSAAQNIEEMCFRKGAILETEFRNLLASLFRKAHRHEAVVNALALKARGMSRNELVAAATGITSGGSLTRVLEELEESGFIQRYTPFNNKSKNTLYRLSDFYSTFYLKFIKDNTNYEAGVWTNAIDHPSQRAWAGYAFEQVCLAHIPQIKKALGISGILSHTSSWKSARPENGAQIDLVIDRRDQVINLCEVKYSINPYSITKAYADNLRNKVGAFRDETKTRKAVFLTMITTFGLERNAHAGSVVQNEIRMDALFGDGESVL
ncbi:MAG: ATP-binding protein [Saprospiraceae bacterium]